MYRQTVQFIQLIHLKSKLRISGLKEKIQNLENRLEYLENKLNSTSLYSEHFLKRSFTILGHYWVAALIISIPMIIFMMIGLSIIARIFLPEIQDYGW